MPKPAFLNLSLQDQDKILYTAAEELKDRGIRQVTMDGVAARMKLGAEELSRYFENMPDIIASVLGRGIQYFNQTYIEVGAQEAAFWERVERLLSLAALRGSQFGAYLNVYFNISGSGLPELVRATYKRFEGRAALFFQNLVVSGVHENALRRDLDVPTVALHFQDITRLVMSRWTAPLYTARSEAYYPDIPLSEEGDRVLIILLIDFLKALYAAPA